MHTHQIACLALTAALFTGCFQSPGVSDSPEVEDLKRELAQLKESGRELQDKYIAQNEEMTRILEEVSSITGRTSELRLDVEHGSARLTQAEQLSSSITGVKARISALEKSLAAMGGENKEFQKMIDGLNKVISQQESVIFDLREVIESKDYTIERQRDTITSQTMTIERQMAELEALVQEQAKSLCEAGMALEQVADEAPEVSWRRNREKMDDMRQHIYKMALSSYRKSYESGYEPAREHIATVLSKIQAD